MPRRNQQEHARLWDDFNAWKREQGLFLDFVSPAEEQPVDFAVDDASTRIQPLDTE